MSTSLADSPGDLADKLNGKSPHVSDTPTASNGTYGGPQQYKHDQAREKSNINEGTSF
jgi:hypothetical protein